MPPPPSTEPQPADDTLELEIERLAPGGDGVAHDASGRVVFVPWTAPGDRVRVRITERRARFARGRIESLCRPGPERREPACEVFGECGGCRWQHVGYPAQLEAKRDFIRDALRRIGHLEVPEPVEIVASPVEYGYRLRTRVRVEGSRVGYRRPRSHALCPTRACPILMPALERALPELPRRARGRPGDWWLAVGSDGGVQAAPVVAPRDGPSGRRARLRLEVSGQVLESGLGSFTQGNGPLFQTLASAVAEAAGRGALAVDLFAGAGYLTLGLAARFSRVLAVEGDHRSVRDLAKNRERAGASGIELIAAPVEEALREPPVAGSVAEVIVLDPPRTGLPPGAADALVGLATARLVYLSCDPATLARDAARLAAGGYRLVSVRGFDLFPQTPHVEVLAVFARDA